MCREKEIIKSVPSTFRSVLEKIERVDLLSDVDNFYDNKHSNPKFSNDERINHGLESLYEVLNLIIASLISFQLNLDHQSNSLSSVLTDLEKVFYKAYTVYEAIPEAIQKFPLGQARGKWSLECLTL